MMPQSHEARVAELAKTCPGLAFLRQALTRAVAAAGAGKIRVYDNEGIEIFLISEDGVERATRYALEVDAVLNYGVEPFAFLIVYDGPYTAENAAEIVMDCNQRGSDLLNEILHNAPAAPCPTEV